MKGCSSECREWIGELTDDSTKQAFMALAALEAGDRARALEYVESQSRTRLPLMAARVAQECGKIRDNPTKLIQADLDAIANGIAAGKGNVEVKKAIYRFDKKWALGGYYRFCKCGGGR